MLEVGGVWLPQRGGHRPRKASISPVGSQVVRAVRVQAARRLDQPPPQEVRGLQGDRRRPQDSAP
jgi:hypothetical protein